LGDHIARDTASPYNVSPRRLLVPICLLALGVWALRDIARMGDDLPWRVMYDFQDFYCAGNAIDHRHSPYTYEPLRSCEHDVNHGQAFRINSALAVPAPQPPYDFTLFMALARLDYARAKVWYAVAIVVAILLTAATLNRLGIPLDVALAALALSAGFHELNAGQIIPFALLSLALTGWMLAVRQDEIAGVFAALTAIEPHLGISVMLAVLLFAPRTRPTALIAAAALAGIAVAMVGASGTVAYLTRVLPAQAAAEVRFPYQYSLTYVLHFAGARDAAALTAGALSFFVLLVASLWLAPLLAARLQRRELLVFLPAAIGVIAGAYVHMVELCFAIPAALILSRYARGVLRVVAVAALCLLAVPWILAWSVKKLFLASVFVCAVLVYRLRAGPAASTVILLLVAASLYVLELNPRLLPTPSLVPPYPSDGLVQIEWHAFVQGLDTHDPLWIAVKIPAWCALVALLTVAIGIVRQRKPNDTPLPSA
jgi:hypothetical protein